MYVCMCIYSYTYIDVYPQITMIWGSTSKVPRYITLASSCKLPVFLLTTDRGPTGNIKKPTPSVYEFPIYDYEEVDVRSQSHTVCGSCMDRQSDKNTAFAPHILE